MQLSSRIKDETGNRYGKLTVIDFAGTHGKNAVATWNCKCDCGNERVVAGKRLRNGSVTMCHECAKLRHDLICSEKLTIDMIGQKYGHLTVLEYVGAQSGNHHGALWRCKCDCGNECIVLGTDLRTGHRSSCGCQGAQNLIKSAKEKFIDLSGQQFGEWSVLYRADHNSVAGEILWVCQCSCGTIAEVHGRNLRSGHSTSCGCKRASRGEIIITNILKENKIPFIAQKTFETCIFPDSKAKARFDFYINDQYLIEYDGELHFTTNNVGWNNEENLKKTQEHDQIKNQWCKDNNIPLIRIPYTHYENLCLEDLLLETSKYIIN